MHAGKILDDDGVNRYLILRQLDPHTYQWFKEDEPGQEAPTEIQALTVLEAIHKAEKKWFQNDFRTILCGFRYSLPERDEHGVNALFHQMAASYSTSGGVYFDEEVGYNCIVQFASAEALSLFRRLGFKP